jgi:hypothetical protein
MRCFSVAPVDKRGEIGFTNFFPFPPTKQEQPATAVLPGQLYGALTDICAVQHGGRGKVMKWNWLLWQVLVPLLSPIVFSTIFVFLWSTGQPKFVINWHIIADVSPWALTFYCFALIGSSMKELWPKISNHTVLGLFLFIDAIAVALYAAFMVIWRHDPSFTPGPPVYFVAILLLAETVVLCHQAAP